MNMTNQSVVILACSLLLIGCGPLPETADKTSEADAGNQPARRVAEAGVGKQGKSLSGKNILSAPVKALFNARQQLEFAKVTQALQLYQASNGHYPKSHEEFMSEIIEPNMIQLPELPTGERYQFDPQTGELMVEPIPNQD